MTHQEIDLGLFKLPKSEIENNCMCYIRTISDLHSKLDYKKAAKYIDLLPERMDINTEKYEAVMMLRNGDIPNTMPKENIYREEVSWHGDEGMSSKGHKDYLDKLGRHFMNKIRSMIAANIERKNKVQVDELYSEVVQHLNMAKDRCASFKGRKGILNEIKQYVLGMTDKPLVLHGASGNGKTSIMTKAVSMLPSWMKEKGKYIETITILRCCGTSPASSNIQQLLKSLCHQMTYATGQYRHLIPTDYKEIKKYFTDFVYGGEFGGIMFIFLDALDQLNPDEGALKLDWVPARLANNVKLIVSTLPEDHGLLSKLKNKIPQESHFIEVPPLEESTCMRILDNWLSNSKRQITFHQRKVVKNVIAQCQNPLFLKLTFDEILSWRSYTEVDDLSLGWCVEDCIDKLFDHLEEKHGKTFVAHALSYITASRGGIGQSEMEDILSLDDEVLNSIFIFWEPPIRRIPASLWSRLHHDIASYLVGREINETEVLYWYHRQFIEASARRYLGNAEQNEKIHGLMAEYYMGTWSGQNSKPHTYEDPLAKRKKVPKKTASAIRHVPVQPLLFDNSKRYNIRKLNQLPYHLYNAGKLQELNKEVFFNFSWLHAKLAACSIQPVIADYNMVDAPDVNLVADCLRMSEAALVEDVNVLGVEITGRLLPHAVQHPRIKMLIQKCDLNASRYCPLVANWQAYTTPGGPLQYVCEPEHDIRSDIDVDIIQSKDTLLLTAKPFYSSRMQIWDVTQGEPKPEMTLPKGSEVYPTLNGDYINLIKNNRFLQTFSIESGELYGEVEFGHGNIGDVAVANRYVVIRFDQGPGPAIVDIIARANITRLRYQCDAIALSEDDKYMVCNKGYILMLHELPVLEKARLLVKASNIPVKITFSRSKSPQIYVLYQDKRIQVIDFDLPNKKAKRTDIVQDFEIQDFKLSHKQELLMARAGRCLFFFYTKDRSFAYRIQEMPSGAFVEKLSKFKEAGFTLDDKLVVAARYTYLGVWETKTGRPLRLLQSSVSPIEKLFTSEIVNKTITLLKDNSIQVWNMDNLESEVMHLNALVKGEVAYLDVSSSGQRLVASALNTSVAKIFNNDTGECEWSLVHDYNDTNKITKVQMSPLGLYAMTYGRCHDVPHHERPWGALNEVKLWSMETGQTVMEISRIRHVVWDPTEQRLVMFLCRSYSHHDWLVKAYDAIIYEYATGQQKHLVVPPGSFVGEPVITMNGKYLAFILQSTEREPEDYKKRKCELSVHLYTYSFHGQWNGFNKFSIRDILTRVSEADVFLDIKALTENMVLVTYAKQVKHYKVTTDGIIDRSPESDKGAFTFDISRSAFIQRFDDILQPTTDLSKLVVSGNGLVVMDEDYNIIHIASGEVLSKAQFLRQVAAPGSIQFIQNGKYYTLITANRRELHVYRIGNDKPAARLFIHGTASCLAVGKGDRLIAVGCVDGRVMVFTAIQGLPDAYRELIMHLPSRTGSQGKPKSLLSQDRVTAHSDMHDLYRLSLRTKLEHAEQNKKSPAFKSLGHAVHFTSAMHKVNSKACVIQ